MNILTFDIEEWFHILDNESTKTEGEWKTYSPRLHTNMQRIFDILERSEVKATFFVLGWIAEQYPSLIKEISSRGFDIGSHSRMHQLVYEQSPTDFREDLKRSIHTLEDLTGKKITMYRSPGFSLTESVSWAFEELIEMGIEVDSSIFPAERGHGGFPSFGSAQPTIIEIAGKQIKEFPINTIRVLNRDIIFSGGGYFRLAPYRLIKKWTKASDYVMTYFHPRDFDPDQPMIKELSYSRRFKSYVGLKNCESKLENWLSDFDFIDLNEAVSQTDWNKSKIIQL